MARNSMERVDIAIGKGDFEEPEMALAAWERYEALKSGIFALDYDDLLCKWEGCLAANQDYADFCRRRWKLVVVDEMQDNNALQYAIVSHIKPDRIIGVGDMNQSIYGWRSAAPELFAEFAGQAEKFNIGTNYRSHSEILDVANNIVAGLPFTVHLNSAKGEGGAFIVHRSADFFDEGKRVVREIRRLHMNGIPLHEIAVLARSSASVVGIEMALKAERVHYKKYGGKRVSESKIVQDFLCVLRFATNPKNNVAALDAFCLFKGIGPKTAVGFIKDRGWEKFWPPKAAPLKTWVETIGSMEPGQSVGYLFESMQPLLKQRYKSDFESRVVVLKWVVQTLMRSNLSIHEMLDLFAIDPIDPDHPDDCLTVSTIHSAKGLEWDAVFLVGAGSKQMPPKWVGPDDERGLAEERRLMYVAVTRAKRYLHVSYPVFYDQKHTQDCSPFLPDDIF